MDHIYHLEDLVFTEDARLVFELAAILPSIVTGQNTSDFISLKVDGSPAIAFGRDDMGMRWVGPKSAIKNVTKRFYSSPCISGARFEDMWREVYGWIHTCEMGVSYQADLISSRNLYTRRQFITGRDKEIDLYHPNTLAYSVAKPAFKDCANANLILSVHTRVDAHGEQAMRSDDPLVLNALDVYQSTGFKGFMGQETEFKPTKPFSPWSVESEHRDLLLQISNTLRNEDLTGVIETQHAFASKAYEIIGKKIRTLKREDAIQRWLDKSSHLTRDIIDNPQMIEMWLHLKCLKHPAINILDSRITSCLTPYVIDAETNKATETQHEGYVLRLFGVTTKLVDRTKFSSYNFSDKIKKGWDRENVRTTKRDVDIRREKEAFSGDEASKESDETRSEES